MDCEIEFGLALGSTVRCPGVEAGTVRTALEGDVDLMGSGGVVRRVLVRLVGVVALLALSLRVPLVCPRVVVVVGGHDCDTCTSG
jgi:hypothetical protein